MTAALHRETMWSAVNCPDGVSFAHEWGDIPAGTRATLRQFGVRYAYVQLSMHAHVRVPLDSIELAPHFGYDGRRRRGEP